MGGRRYVNSYSREAWVIPNGAGRLWTDRIFDTEAEAKAKVDEFWERYSLAGRRHVPVLTMVEVKTKLRLTDAGREALRDGG